MEYTALFMGVNGPVEGSIRPCYWGYVALLKVSKSLWLLG